MAALMSSPRGAASQGRVATLASLNTYAYLRGIEPVTGKDLRKHFSGWPGIISSGIQLYDVLGEQDSGYAGDLRVTNEWARILNVSDWFA